MKKLIPIVTISLLLLSFSFTQKTYKVNLTEAQINMLYQTLETSKQAIPTSTIPVNVAVETLKNIDSLQLLLSNEYRAQRDSVK